MSSAIFCLQILKRWSRSNPAKTLLIRLWIFRFQALDKIVWTMCRTVGTHVKNALSKPHVATTIRHITAIFSSIPNAHGWPLLAGHRRSTMLPALPPSWKMIPRSSLRGQPQGPVKRAQTSSLIPHVVTDPIEGSFASHSRCSEPKRHQSSTARHGFVTLVTHQEVKTSGAAFWQGW